MCAALAVKRRESCAAPGASTASRVGPDLTPLDSKGSLWGLFRKDGFGLGGWVTFCDDLT